MVIIIARDSQKISTNKYVLTLSGLLIGIFSFLVIRDAYGKHWSTGRGIISRKIEQEYRVSNQEGKEKIREISQDHINNSEIYFATMMGKQFEVISR